jgi:indolepyruvate ferredoxin oxidoreductase alpha subunit
VAVIGDSTFAHSGLTGVLHMAYNGGTGTVVVLDNRTTAMTGRQGNPLNAVKLSGGTGPEIDLGELGHALGAGAVRFVDPNDFGETLAVLREETAAEHLSIVVAQSPCVLLTRETHDPYAIDEELCTDCGLCLRLGCPAISRAEGGKPGIDISVCVGCGQCPQVCRYDAIVVTGAACDFGGAR